MTPTDSLNFSFKYCIFSITIIIVLITYQLGSIQKNSPKMNNITTFFVYLGCKKEQIAMLSDNKITEIFYMADSFAVFLNETILKKNITLMTQKRLGFVLVAYI